MLTRFIYLLTCLLPLSALLGGLTGCHTKHPMDDYQTEKFDLSASPGAVGHYPVQIHRGEFTNSATGGGFPVPYGHYLEGDSWGSSGIGWGVGDPMQSVPDSLHLRWYAWAEDKFYEGRFALPQRKMYALLKQGYWNSDTKQHETYQTLLVSVLPQGGVVLWLQGQNQVLVGRFQAPATNYSWLQFNGGHPSDRAQVVAEYQRDMLPQVREQIAAGTVSSKKWDDYLAAVYPWQVEVVELDGQQRQPLPVSNYYISYVTAEHTRFALTQDPAPYLQTLLEPRPKPVPTDLGVFVQNKYGEKHEVRVDSLDEAQTLAAFRALHKTDPQSPLTLTIALSKLSTKATLTLRNPWKAIELTKAKIKVFALRH